MSHSDSVSARVNDEVSELQKFINETPMLPKSIVYLLLHRLYVLKRLLRS